MQRTTDGMVLVGRCGQEFRIISHQVDLTMKAPPGWKVFLCTEEPLAADVVCESPDKARDIEISARPWTAHNVDPSPRYDLPKLHRHIDPEIKMGADHECILPDGRRLPIWRFFSTYWGEHLCASFTDHGSVMYIDVSSRKQNEELASLRRILTEFVASYRVKNVRS